MELQQLLLEMEDRISKRVREDINLVGSLARQDSADVRADIKQVGDIARDDIRELRNLVEEQVGDIRQAADEESLNRVEMDGRIKRLEEKMSWITAGFGAVVVSLIAFVWRVITGGK